MLNALVLSAATNQQQSSNEFTEVSRSSIEIVVHFSPGLRDESSGSCLD